MKGGVAGAGQAGVAFVDLDEGIAYVEVGVIVVSRQPAGGGVGDLLAGCSVALVSYPSGRIVNV
jgi:hypothetical protein